MTTIPKSFIADSAASRTPSSFKPEPAQPTKTSFLGGLGNLAGGAVYGLSSPGRTIQGALSKGADKLFGTSGFGQASKQGFEQSTKTDLDTTSGKVGNFLGQAATFAVPGAAALKAPTLLGKMAASGAADATVQSLNQGGIDRNTLDSAIIGSVFPGLGKLGSMARTSLTKETGSRIINSLIKPVSKQFAYGKDPGRAVAEMGITANSLDELAEKVGTARTQTGEQLSQLAKQVPSSVRIKATEALSSFDEAMDKAVRNNDQAVLNRLREARTAITNIMGQKDGQIVPVGSRILDDLTYDQARELKKVIGDITKWTGQVSEDASVNGALTRAYGSLSSQMDELTTGLDPQLASQLRKLNQRYGDLTSAEIATKYRDALAQRANMLPFGAKTLGTAAGITTGLLTGGVTPAILVGLGVAGFDKAMATPAFKTRIASWLAKASTSEKEAMFTQVPWLRSALQTSLGGSEEEAVNASD